MDAAERVELMDVLPRMKEPTGERSVRLFKRQWERLAELGKGGHSANELLQHFVDWCLQEIDRVRQGDPHPEAKRVLEMLAVRGNAKLADALRDELSAELKKNARR